ncbi:MAG: hypothetical protein CMP22_01925 [Rickettsiales bacterium]|nr:hypothetical protein [Rickettsiales bacterium]|tara:strand:- start:1671 stop:2162 length:492 start_codon:yes stop_codon:yes gene_type:complete
MNQEKDDILRAFLNNKKDILEGRNFMPLLVSGFRNYVRTDFDNGETIINLVRTSQSNAAVEDEAKVVDVFILDAGCELGAHFHQHASANIFFLNGSGKALIGDEIIEFKAGDTAKFPKGVVHNVLANDDSEKVVFISYQDHPIQLSENEFDFHNVPNAKSLRL